MTNKSISVLSLINNSENGIFLNDKKFSLSNISNIEFLLINQLLKQFEAKNQNQINLSIEQDVEFMLGDTTKISELLEIALELNLVLSLSGKL